MITLDSIRKPVTAELAAFDEFVERQFTAEGELLSDMLRYALSSRGKGIRPLLVMLSAAMNASVPGAATGRRACLAAMLVEMIHVASLIHDDVIDEADTRRGKPSVNARWQSHKAVILGDYILARNMAIGLTSGQFDLVTHVCGSMAALCEGEVMQDECAETHDMTRRTYLDMMADNGVRAIFSGHRHAYIYRTYRGMELVTASALGRPLGKAPSGVEVIVVEDGELSHRYCAIEEIPHSREELRQLLRQE